MDVDYCLTEAEKAIKRVEKHDSTPENVTRRLVQSQLATSYAILALVQTLREQQ